MPVSPCLYRRSSGIYVVRIVVPKRLRKLVGRGELHISTGLRNPIAAKIASLRIQLDWRQKFMSLDLERLSAGSPLLQGNGLLPVMVAATAMGLSESALLAELSNVGAPLAIQAQYWRGLSFADHYDIERDYDGTFVLSDVEARGEPNSMTGPVWIFDTPATISALLTSGISAESWFALDGTAAFRTSTPIEIKISALMVSKPHLESVRISLLARTSPHTAIPVSTPTDLAKADTVGPSEKPTKRISEVFERYKLRQQWSKQQVKRMTTEVGYFIELMNDPLITAIDIDVIDEYAATLAKLPTDIYQTRRKLENNQSLRDLIAIAERDALPLKSEATIKRHVSTLGEVLNFAVSPGGYIRINPANRFKRPRKDNSKQDRPQDKRDVFEQDELIQIFSQLWFQSGAGDFSRGGKHTDFRPHHFWLPLIALVTGARVNELSQLYLDDVRCSEAGIWYLDFNLIQADKVDEPDKSLKTLNSIRVVPLHDVVITAGLPAYIDRLRDSGYDRLFPELKRDELKGYGKPVSSWFNERFLGRQLKIKRNGKKTFHSFRHTFTTALDRLDLNERLMAQLLGHQRGKTEGTTRYTKDRDADLTKPIIDQLQFDCLENLGRFDVELGINAIACALRRKAAIKRAIQARPLAQGAG